MRQTRRFLVVITIPVILPIAATAAGFPESAPAKANQESTEVSTPTAAESRILAYLDRDGNSVLDANEWRQFPSPMRAWMAANGLRIDEPLSLSDFVPTLRPMLADLREGRFSVGAGRRARYESPSRRSTTSSRTPEPAKIEYPRVEVNGYEGIVAERTFARLDKKPMDGKLTLDEWDENTRALLEEAEVPIPNEMDRDTFLQHVVRIMRQQ